MSEYLRDLANHLTEQVTNTPENEQGFYLARAEAASIVAQDSTVEDLIRGVLVGRQLHTALGLLFGLDYLELRWEVRGSG